MSLYQELQSLALNQHRADSVNKLSKHHAQLLKNGNLKELYNTIEADFYVEQNVNHSNYACEVLVTDY